jgi:integrase
VSQPLLSHCCALLAPRTVRYIHVTLNKALKQAVADGLISRNAASSVKSPKPKKKESRPLDREQVREFFDAVSGERLEPLYLLAVTAGLRKGELLGLKWEDLDLETGMLQVRRSLSETRSGHIFEAPKSGKGRSVRLTQRALNALRKHRTRQLEERMKLAGVWQEHGLVFPSHVGTPIGGRNLSRSFKRHLERAGLPRSFRFHDLRHTCATLLLRRGVNPKFVQELLGHDDVSVTLNIYSHVLPGMGDHAALAMEAALQ